MTRLGRRPRRDDRGAAAVELALLIPATVILLGLLIAGGRLWFARTTVTDAAQASARAASLSRTEGDARHDADLAADRALRTRGLDCRSTEASVDLGAFNVAAGTPATVTAEIDCTVAFADLLLPGMPGSIRLTGRGAAALDTYRARS